MKEFVLVASGEHVRRDGLRAFGAIGTELFGETWLAEFALTARVCHDFFHVEEVNHAAVTLEAVRVVASVIERAFVGRDLSLAKGTVDWGTVDQVELFLVDGRLVERMVVLVGFVRDSL